MNSWLAFGLILGLLFVGSVSLDYAIYANNGYAPLNLGAFYQYVPPVNTVNISPSPPISENLAVKLALHYGGWNESSLSGMNVSVSFDYMYFIGAHPGHLISSFSSGQVTNNGIPVKNYNPFGVGLVTLRYVWTVVVQYNGSEAVPPPGYYCVDAMTGEISQPIL